MSDEDVVQDETEFTDDLDEDIEPEDLDEDELDEDEELTDLEENEDLEGDVVDEDEEDELPTETPVRRVTTEEDDDDEDLVDPDDVEADLDTILKDRLVAAEDEADEDEEEVEVDDRGDPVDRILPKRPGEFVCQSCFLVKHPGQLADARRQLCSDCV